jgi:hypothetical protein
VGELVECGSVAQTLTHREVRVRVRTGRAAGTPRAKEVKWVAPGRLGEVGLSSLSVKMLRQAGVSLP